MYNVNRKILDVGIDKKFVGVALISAGISDASTLGLWLRSLPTVFRDLADDGTASAEGSAEKWCLDVVNVGVSVVVKIDDDPTTTRQRLRPCPAQSLPTYSVKRILRRDINTQICMDWAKGQNTGENELYWIPTKVTPEMVRAFSCYRSSTWVWWRLRDLVG